MRQALAVLAILVFVSMIPMPALAIVNEVDRVFYNDCGPGRFIVGEIYTDCTGHVTAWGQVTDFEERNTTVGCDGPTTTTYWECGVKVKSLDICIC